MFDRFDHLVETCEFGHAMDVVLPTAQVWRWQPFFRELAAVGSASHDCSIAGAIKICERLFGQGYRLWKIF